MKKRVLIITILLVFTMSVLMTGCSAKQAETTAVQDKVYKWTLQSTSPSGTLTYKLTEDFAKDVAAATNNRLQIQVHAVGAVVPYNEVTAAVGKGSIQAGTPNVSIDLGRIGPKAMLLGASGSTGGMGPVEFLTWFYEYGGLNYAQKIYEPLGVHVVGVLTVSPAELFAHSNKPITAAKDLKGLKFRTMGLWGEVLTKMGASVVTMSGGDIYESMQRGVIDAFEYCGAGINWDMGYAEIGKYVTVPGIHSPFGMEDLFVSTKAWAELPDDLKKIVEEVCRSYSLKSYMRIAMDDAAKMKKFEDDPKVQVMELSQDVQKEIIKLTNEIHVKNMAADPLYKEIYENQKTFVNTFKNLNKKVQPSLSLYDE